MRHDKAMRGLGQEQSPTSDENQQKNFVTPNESELGHACTVVWVHLQTPNKQKRDSAVAFSLDKARNDLVVWSSKALNESTTLL